MLLSVSGPPHQIMAARQGRRHALLAKGLRCSLAVQVEDPEPRVVREASRERRGSSRPAGDCGRNLSHSSSCACFLDTYAI